MALHLPDDATESVSYKHSSMSACFNSSAMHHSADLIPKLIGCGMWTGRIQTWEETGWLGLATALVYIDYLLNMKSLISVSHHFEPIINIDCLVLFMKYFDGCLFKGLFGLFHLLLDQRRRSWNRNSRYPEIWPINRFVRISKFDSNENCLNYLPLPSFLSWLGINWPPDLKFI